MKPVLQALLVADHVYQDLTTGKRIVVGIFDKLFFPAKRSGLDENEAVNETGEAAKRKILEHRNSGSPSAYVSMTSVRGTQNFSIRYVFLNDDKVLFAISFQVNCQDPLETVQLIVPLPSLPIIEAGTYALELLCDDEPLGAFRITAEEIEEPANDDDSA